MKHLRLAKRNKTVDPVSFDEFYAREVVNRIRMRYSVNDELSVIRQRDQKPEEFEAYNAYVESCKRDVKAEMVGE